MAVFAFPKSTFLFLGLRPRRLIGDVALGGEGTFPARNPLKSHKTGLESQPRRSLRVSSLYSDSRLPPTLEPALLHPAGHRVGWVENVGHVVTHGLPEQMARRDRIEPKIRPEP